MSERIICTEGFGGMAGEAVGLNGGDCDGLDDETLSGVRVGPRYCLSQTHCPVTS